MPWRAQRLHPRSAWDESGTSLGWGRGWGPRTAQSCMLRTGAGSGTATLAAEFIRQHPNSRHCLIPSWTGERQPQGDKGVIVCWIRAPVQDATSVVGHNAVPCHRDLLSPRDCGAPSGPHQPSLRLSLLFHWCLLTTQQFPVQGFQPATHNPALQSPGDPGDLCPCGSTPCSCTEQHVLLGSTWTSKTHRHPLASP